MTCDNFFFIILLIFILFMLTVFFLVITVFNQKLFGIINDTILGANCRVLRVLCILNFNGSTPNFMIITYSISTIIFP